MERRELIEAIDAELKRLEEARRLLIGSGTAEKPRAMKGTVGAAKKKPTGGEIVQRRAWKKAFKKSSKKNGAAGRIIGGFRGARRTGGSGGTDDGGYGLAEE